MGRYEDILQDLLDKVNRVETSYSERNMFIVLAGTPGRDSTGLQSNTRPIKMCPFSSTLMEATLSRGVELRKEEVMIYVTKTLFILASFCI